MKLVVAAIAAVLVLSSCVFFWTDDSVDDTEFVSVIVAFDDMDGMVTTLDKVTDLPDVTLRMMLPLFDAVSAVVEKGSLAAIRDLPHVKYVEEAITVFALPLRTDPPALIVPPSQVVAIPVESEIPWNMKMIDADEGWYDNQGVGIYVGILDTGIASRHPDFLVNPNDPNSASAVVAGFNAIDGGSTQDDNDHGTYCASIVGARRNGVGLIGVARGCSLVPIKVLASNGSGSSIHVCEGYQWAMNNDVDMISCSLGSYSKSQAMADAMERARKLGMGTVCANGNDGLGKIIYPARNSYAIKVGAVGTNGNRTSWSNYGPEMIQDGVVAPGDYVMAARRNGTWTPVSGTSIATPHVTGTLALLDGKGMPWREFIYRGASLADSPTAKLGHGLINVMRAIELLEAYVPPADEAGLYETNRIRSWRTHERNSESDGQY